MGITVDCYPKGIYGENTYIITDDATGYKAVIDPGYYGTDIKMGIQNNAYLKYLLLTHAHHDHFYAVDEYLAEYSAVNFAAPLKDKPLMGDCPEPHTWLKEGDIISLGATDLKVIETPGHTAGGICFVTNKEIFTGDTLFRVSVGRTDLESGDWDTLVKSISEKLYTLDEDMVVYPGHGASTTIGFEKRVNPFV